MQKNDVFRLNHFKKVHLKIPSVVFIIAKHFSAISLPLEKEEGFSR